MDNFDLKKFLVENKMTRNSILLNEDESLEELPLTTEIKQEVDNAIAKAIKDRKMEYLQQVGYWENDFEENLLITFEDKFPNAYEISDALHNYIQNKVYGEDKLDGNQSTNSFEQLLNSIPNQKYFYIAIDEYNDFFGPEVDHSPTYDYSRFDVKEDGDLVDYFYNGIFNNELKGKPGVKGNNFNEFQSIDDEENNGENVKLLYDKITQIITDFKKQINRGRNSALNENQTQDFDLKRFLVENKMTRNSRLLNEQPEPDGIPADDPLAQIPAVPAETPTEPSGEVDVETAKELIFNTGGKFFTVTFIKKDGSERVMNARLGVKKYLRGGELKFNPSEMGLIPVYDMGAKGYRMVNTNTIKNLKIGKNEYVIPTAVSE